VHAVAAVVEVERMMMNVVDRWEMEGGEEWEWEGLVVR
jgi:hypothetical protein